MVALLPLAACYGPTYRDCAIACGSEGCPVGMACVDGFCRASGANASCVDAPPPPPGDGDGDTVTDDMDNCPMVKNTDQANEDMDEYGDVCDPCPVFGGIDNNDKDGDLVGNGCDPNIDVGGDVIVLFDGFNARPETATITGDWTFVDGQARISDSAVDGIPSDIVWMLDIPANEVMLARIYIANLAGASAAAGIVGQLGANNGFSCVAGVDSGNNQKVMIRNRLNTIVDSQVADESVTGGEPYTIDMSRFGQDYRCNAPDKIPMRAMYTSTMTPSTTAQYGLRVYDASAHYNWIMVVSTP